MIQVQIIAPGDFCGWIAIVQQWYKGERRRGAWLLVPGHPWQEMFPDQPWHFYAHEFRPAPGGLGDG